MTVAAMLEERGLEVDDVRWYLSALLARRLIEHRRNVTELVRLIWSGKLEAELYRMEERFLEELERKLEEGIRDEHVVREILRDVENERRARWAKRGTGER